MAQHIFHPERCCGKSTRSWLGIEKAKELDLCTHDYFLVRIDRVTGEQDHIPHVSDIGLAMLSVLSGEWQKGVPK